MRKWSVLLAATAACCAVAALGTMPGRADSGVGFELAIKKGRLVQNDVIVNPGVRPPTVKFKNDGVAECVAGTASDSFCRDFLENDAGGAFYVFCDDRSTWRFATNPDGLLATDLEGNVDPKGNFMMAGTHALSGMRVFLVGKAKLAKGTFTPTKLSGTAYFTSPTIQEFGSAKFKSISTIAPR